VATLPANNSPVENWQVVEMSGEKISPNRHKAMQGYGSTVEG
jgi:hypothetical protein